MLFLMRHSFLKTILPIMLIVLCLTVFTGRDALCAQDRFDEYQVKSAFLYNLANFIYWPNESFESPQSPFIITVLGKNPFNNFLVEITSGETVNGHPIRVEYVDSFEELGKTHILFVHRDSAKDIDEQLLQLSQLGVLTVSDFDQFPREGGALALLMDRQRILLTLNLEVAERAGLKISSKLLRLATIVKGQRS